MWNLHIDRDNDGDITYQFQTHSGEVLFELRDSEIGIPGLARAAALRIFEIANAGRKDATIDGDAAGADAL